MLNLFLLISGEAQIQPESFQAAKLGDTVEVNCQVYSGSRTMLWYKLNTDRRLQLLASISIHKGQIKYTDDRFSVQTSTSSSVLRISKLTWKDTGTYYCGVMNFYDVNFGSGTVLVIKGDSRPMESVVQRPDNITVQPGDSVTLSCSFITSHCPEEHISGIWLKSGFTSEIISWINGNERVTCESRAHSGETTCVHNFTMKALSSADDGTYLCVVTSCGQTLFGNGTRLHLNSKIKIRLF